MKQNSRRIIGLTGGIATGKTTVSDYLANNYHLSILDADIYAKEAVEINSPILETIKQRYGDRICSETGELNRQKLGKIIFNDSIEKKWLESQIHPYVRQRFKEEINQSQEEVIILDIPLLFESNLTYLVTEIWIVYCSYEKQMKRLMKRNNLTEKDAIARIKSQLPINEKVKMGDIVLDNSSNLGDLYQQIDEAIKLHK
ncbi:MAG: dephospho-CoA kinase [Crocosphaera sp.]|nr:dephospho-CoA kinase [Crocosphaera sp.]